MEKTMREQLSVIFSRNHITADDIIAGGFGLAGSDLPAQRGELINRVKKMGFKNFNVFNDGILGIKAASENGAGICVVNGTSTVVIGIDLNGKILQVGGVGEIAGDLAGGTYVMRRCIYYLYEYYFRCGRPSGMFPEIMKMLNTTEE
jgi:N-acetylglucosamine kinase-like BadF-type ATPase